MLMLVLMLMLMLMPMLMPMPMLTLMLMVMVCRLHPEHKDKLIDNLAGSPHVRYCVYATPCHMIPKT